jgi:hypothetical protein
MIDHMGPSFMDSPLPAGAEEYLRPDNPRLLELRRRYLEYAPFAYSPLWQSPETAGELDFRFFRGDNAFNYQVRGGYQEASYLLTAYYVKENDRLGLWDRLTEDGLFGAYIFDFNQTRYISRDLLDSILQINFLDRYAGLSRLKQATVLDIGAGYGRLAWRMARGLTNLGHVWCTDAVPESTFLCEYFLSFRGVDQATSVVPLDCIAESIKGRQIDIVTNVHSFSECTLEGITWWLDILGRASVTYLMIIPNTPDAFLTNEKDGSSLDFAPAIESHGYRLVRCEFMFDAPSIRQHGVYGHRKVWLFRRG